MRALLAVLVAVNPVPAPAPKASDLVKPVVTCFVDPDAITHVVVCIDRDGRPSWIA